MTSSNWAFISSSTASTKKKPNTSSAMAKAMPEGDAGGREQGAYRAAAQVAQDHPSRLGEHPRQAGPLEPTPIEACRRLGPHRLGGWQLDGATNRTERPQGGGGEADSEGGDRDARR
jgi:hypothetical protein